ncbi:hypothetical protein M9Y10_007153 [Tritrichomonas musculus]|uniref:Uncharacterized protein n=1 Tax=Tritrichomonas musculus TaxID=1915356 RepID=A0ABR2J1I7_9EUKA
MIKTQNVFKCFFVISLILFVLGKIDKPKNIKLKFKGKFFNLQKNDSKISPQQNSSFLLDHREPSNFSLPKNFHVRNSFRHGGLCIALLSSNRPEYLSKTLPAFLEYIYKYEPNLDYTLVWVDTATNNIGQLNIELDERFHFDKKVFLSTFARSKIYEGVTASYKLALSLCEKNDYFMPFEEDWLLIDSPTKGFLQITMSVLEKAPHSLMGIVFKETEQKEGPSDPLLVEVGGDVYNVTCQKKRGFQFVNGASIYRMSNMKEMTKDGVNEKTSFELSCTEVARTLGMYFGFIDFVENCTKPKGDCYGVFRHIGRRSMAWGVMRKD